MIKSFIFIVTFIISSNSWAQDYNRVDKIIKSYPTNFNSIDELSNRINNDFKLEENKVRALYNWLSLNIKYDYHNDDFDIVKNVIMYYNIRDKKRQIRRVQLNRIEKTLRLKKGVCLDYSELFREACDRIGIEAEIVIGYSKTRIDDIEREKKYKDHAWNVVKINNKWKLIDVTWATAYASSIPKEINEKLYYYFFTSPEEFIITHFPINPKWQLLNIKKSKMDFFKSPIFYPNYFSNKIKIADFQKGIIEANKNKLTIYFDTVPKYNKFYYKLEGDQNIKPMFFKRTKHGSFISSIRYNKSYNSNMTIYFDLMPIIGFKILSSTD